MRGSDGQLHSTTLEADSVFDAAHKAIERWHMLWWIDHNELITVQMGEQRWTVAQDRVRDWRENRNRR